jgi:hypothetical protein
MSFLQIARRKGRRYVIGLHDHDFILNESEVEKMMVVTNDLIKYIERLLKSIDYSSRKPPLGEYVKFVNRQEEEEDLYMDLCPSTTDY